ncbi:MAG: hypothetical protein AAFV93_20370, partial [Chloroflexota bacterium]
TSTNGTNGSANGHNGNGVVPPDAGARTPINLELAQQIQNKKSDSRTAQMMGQRHCHCDHWLNHLSRLCL